MLDFFYSWLSTESREDLSFSSSYGPAWRWVMRRPGGLNEQVCGSIREFPGDDDAWIAKRAERSGGVMNKELAVEISGSASQDRWRLIRDVLVFQLKLGLDAIRDLVLLPISAFAALLDLLQGGKPTGRIFYSVFALGRRSDVWINLFDTHGESIGNPEGDQTMVDTLVGQIEGLILEQYDRGGVTASAKEAVDCLLDNIPGRRRG